MKIDRMMSILNLLVNNNKITANELAERLEVSKRTIYRDIDSLNLAGIPIISYPGIGGGLGVSPGYKIDKNIFSIDDMKNILTGLLALKSFGDKTNINNLITKIIPRNNDVLENNSEILIDFSSWFSEGNLQNMTFDFRNSILNHNVIALEYYSKNIYSKRNVEPYKLIFKYSFWYLYAFCLQKNAFRLFKLNRISSYEVLTVGFIPQKIDELKLNYDFDSSYFRSSESLVLQEVILECNIKDRRYLIDKIGAYNVKEHTESNLIVFNSSNMEWVADFVIGLQDKVRVLQPISLLNSVKEKIKKMNNIYKS